ncbi:hypothetical protein FACS1894142_5760 [Spirochaetia bacterium]|nr:hypothetical protein FACS1894142_5760 [Spirochaetia bacterium]
MKMNKFSVLGMLTMVLALGLVLTGCQTNNGNPGGGEPYTGPKSIKITGFNEVGLTPVGGYVMPTDKAADAWPPIAVGQDQGTFKLNGQTITVELIDWSIFSANWTTKEPWTGTGECFIVIKGNPGKYDKDGCNYVYSVDGVTAAPVDINSAVTTLEWSKFIWISDYTAE